MPSFVCSHYNLCKILRLQLTRGLSLIFLSPCHFWRNKNSLHEIETPETVQNVLDLDANFFYLHAIAQNNPTGYFCCNKKQKNFRPDPALNLRINPTSGYVGFNEYNFLHIRLNMGKRRVVKHGLPVNGYFKQENTVYEFLRCLLHFCN